MKFNEINQNIITLPKYEKCFVYFLLKGDEVVYVGQTTNGIARPLSHRDKDFDEIKILYCTPNRLDFMEDAFIQKYKPVYNKQSNYAIRWSLLRVRNSLRNMTGDTRYTVHRVKKILKELNIKSEKDYYNGKETISYDEYLAVAEYVGNVENAE